MYWSEPNAFAALGHCRQNVVAAVNGVFSLSFFLLIGSIFSHCSCHWMDNNPVKCAQIGSEETYRLEQKFWSEQSACDQRSKLR